MNGVFKSVEKKMKKKFMEINLLINKTMTWTYVSKEKFFNSFDAAILKVWGLKLPSPLTSVIFSTCVQFYVISLS